MGTGICADDSARTVEHRALTGAGAADFAALKTTGAGYVDDGVDGVDPSQVVRAAGAVVWRRRRAKIEVLLVHRPSYRDWSWPKGKLDAGESYPAAAVREVEEETGVCIALKAPLGTQRYRLSSGRHKVVRYWVATVIERASAPGRARPVVKAASASEIDKVAWVPLDKAINKLTHRADKKLARKLRQRLVADQLDTRTVIVVRHSRAKKRSAWKKGKGAEDDRPLTERGRCQSRHLMAYLSAFGVGRIITSPWKRCVDTVAPYAKAADIPLTERTQLTEDAHRAKPRAVAKLIAKHLDSGGSPVAICTHRPVLPTVVREIENASDLPTARRLPQRDPWLKTGEIMVLHTRRKPAKGEPAVIALERFRPVVRRAVGAG